MACCAVFALGVSNSGDDNGDAHELRSLSLTLHADVADHMVRQGIRLPKRTLLYEYRMNVDWVAMLWARDHVFAADGVKWHCHLRIDSSPQWGKNYLVGEVDRVCTESCSPTDPGNVHPVGI